MLNISSKIILCLMLLFLVSVKNIKSAAAEFRPKSILDNLVLTGADESIRHKVFYNTIKNNRSLSTYKTVVRYRYYYDPDYVIEGETILKHALRMGNVEAADILISDPGIKDKINSGPNALVLLVLIDLIINRFIKDDFLKKFIDKSGINVNYNNFFTTALHKAVFVTDLLEDLLSAGAYPNAQLENGNTPMHKLVSGNYYISSKNIKILLSYGADIRILNNAGSSVLDLAIRDQFNVSAGNTKRSELILDSKQKAIKLLKEEEKRLKEEGQKIEEEKKRIEEEDIAARMLVVACPEKERYGLIRRHIIKVESMEIALLEEANRQDFKKNC